MKISKTSRRQERESRGRKVPPAWKERAAEVRAMMDKINGRAFHVEQMGQMEQMEGNAG